MTGKREVENSTQNHMASEQWNKEACIKNKGFGIRHSTVGFQPSFLPLPIAAHQTYIPALAAAEEEAP